MIVYVEQKIAEQIQTLARMTGKPEEAVLHDVVKVGLRNYHTTPTKGVKALLELAEWAEKNNVTGPQDLSTNHNKYAWEA